MPRGIFHPVLTTVVLTTKELTLAKECPAVPPINNNCPTTYEDGTMLTCDYGEESCCLEEGGPVQTFPSTSCECKDGFSWWVCRATDACYASALNNCADELPSSLDLWDDASSSGCPNEVPNPGGNCTANNDDGAAETTTPLTCDYGTESCCYEEGGPLQIFSSLTCECESSDQSTWVCYYSDACDIPEQYICEGEDAESTDDSSSPSCFGSFLQRLLGGQAYF